MTFKKTCKNCGKIILLKYKSELKRKKFCSIKCSHLYKKEHNLYSTRYVRCHHLIHDKVKNFKNSYKFTKRNKYGRWGDEKPISIEKCIKCKKKFYKYNPAQIYCEHNKRRKKMSHQYRYPEIKRLGDDENKDIFTYGDDYIYICEKVDGGNFSMWLAEDGVHFASRNRDLTLENDTKMFEGYQKYLRDHLNNIKEVLNPNYIYFMECMTPHTLHYNNAPKFIGFDIRLKRMKNAEGQGFFLARELREQEFNRLGIPNVPLIWKGTVKELKNIELRNLIGKSAYGDIMMEGLVIKNVSRKHPIENHQIYAKIVRSEFKEENRVIFGTGIKNKNSDTSKIIEEFCTDARIRKAVLHFTDEGDKLELKLMAKVPTYVIKDILKEESSTIFDKYKFVDFKEMKQKVPKICLRVINEMMEGYVEAKV